MKCPNCNAENHHNNKVCSKCGAPIASTPHENLGALHCPDCGSTDIAKITMLDGKEVDPNAKKGIASIFKKKDHEAVRRCNSCRKEF